MGDSYSLVVQINVPTNNCNVSQNYAILVGGGYPKIDFEVWKYTQITDTVSFKILATLEQINVTHVNI